ncbi:MAG: hypothetical protein H7A32_04985 [Deltaproteobacteria bacterium]|nr:hypothetical protein [Deltaproteobacteria bacterium]
MKLVKNLLVLSGLLIYTLSLATDALAKGNYKDPDAPSVEESQVLGWGPVKTPARKDIPEFLLRGTLVSIQEEEEKPGYYQVTILPVEAKKNSQRHINREHFDSNVTLSIHIPEEQVKNLKVGTLVQYNQYFERKVEQTIGNAAMVNYILHQEFTPYELPPVEYITKAGYYPIQYRNALKGLELFKGNFEKDKALKDALAYHALKAQDPNVKTEASELFTKMFKESPSGNCQESKETQQYVCQ